MISFTIASKSIKYSGITKEVKYLCTENCKTLKSNWKTHKWKYILYSWAGRINMVKMDILPKAIYRVNAIPIKIAVIFHRTRKNNPNICMEPQTPWITKTILGKKNKVEIMFSLLNDKYENNKISKYQERHNVLKYNFPCA